ncbi:MAG TPA: CDP-glucose 4,6-dehydratase [Geminicoccus sp.]|uniref:CDP-glucose 4,6-dehydratase n=1 Tax=Geminicoccus sp. TaxID=2024832 RepID=UPI002E2F3DCA|nr:CDP-glucose 4,6-dehydratase [Geminicoccus sp.]HEX2529571.1 CDP-glucose 4,6-dehydratase [Geminicoccus sp.]
MPDIDQRFWKGRRVLVTGHTGFKGTWLTAWLDQMGAQVTGFSAAPPTQPSLFEASDLATRIDHVEGDVADLLAVEEVLARSRPEVVLHLAGQSILARGHAEPVETFRTNVMGTVSVLEAIRKVGSVRAAVLVTSDKCYLDQHKTCGEDDPLGGLEAYGASKACAEIAVQAYRSSFFPGSFTCGIASARAGNVFGAGDFAANRLVPDLARAFLRNIPPRLRSPDAIRPWQHVLDAVGGYLLLAEMLYERPEAYSTAWNFGPEAGSEWTVGEIADVLARAFGMQGWESAPALPVREEAILRLHTARARRLLSWKPQLTMTEALHWTAQGYKRLDRTGDTSWLGEQIELYRGRLQLRHLSGQTRDEPIELPILHTRTSGGGNHVAA